MFEGVRRDCLMRTWAKSCGRSWIFRLFPQGRCLKRGDRCSPQCSRSQEECCVEGTSPDPSSGDTSEVFDPEISSFRSHSSFYPWIVPSPTLSGATSYLLWPRGCPSLSPNSDIHLTVTCGIRVYPSKPADLGQPIHLDEKGVILTTDANFLS